MQIHCWPIAMRVLILGLVVSGGMSVGFAEDDSLDLSQISSIRESLSKAGGRPVHILYVHGIGATGSGDSLIFQRSICDLLKDCISQPGNRVATDYADSGPFADNAKPPALQYVGEWVWANSEEWSASAPFVDHYVLTRRDGGPIVVDEINWWPLVFPLKCRHIMTGEAKLAGPDAVLLNLCSQPAIPADSSHPGRYRAYTWLPPDEAKKLKSMRERGALFNRKVKNSIFDWGFSDAILAVGSLHTLLEEGMRQLFVKSARFHADGSKSDDWEQQMKNPGGMDREFIVVSHSLGSYLVFSTLNLDRQSAVQQQNALESGSSDATEDSAVQYIFERASLVYFFANQVPLLELANLEESNNPERAAVPKAAQPNAAGALSVQLSKWKQLRQTFAEKSKAAVQPAQIIAWSDPSDLLTWHVPQIDGLVIKNLEVRNTKWHWLIAGPESAHDNYAKNKHVLRVMFHRKPANDERTSSRKPGAGPKAFKNN